MDYWKIVELVHRTDRLITDEALVEQVRVKGVADFVTMVDVSVQRFLRAELAAAYPEVQFFGEEEGAPTPDWSRPYWVLDPIDGTTNLIHGNPNCAVSLALCQNGETRFGVVYNPFQQETFFAVAGEGSRMLRGKSPLTEARPIRVSRQEKLADCVVHIGTTPYQRHWVEENFALFARIMSHTADIRRSGTAAMDLAYVACGRADGYVEKLLQPWDFAAGVLLVTEAGGTITAWDGQPVRATGPQSMLASNGKIQGALAALL